MLDKITKWCKRNDRYRLILDRTENDPYLERYYIFLKDRKWFPFNIFIHRFLKSDPDDLHDHPWPFITVILKGGYWEYTPKGKFWRKPGYINWAASKSLHRVELDDNVKECWTLFIPGPQIREWGFVKNGVWMPFDKYFEIRRNARMLNHDKG